MAGCHLARKKLHLFGLAMIAIPLLIFSAATANPAGAGYRPPGHECAHAGQARRLMRTGITGQDRSNGFLKSLGQPKILRNNKS